MRRQRENHEELPKVAVVLALALLAAAGDTARGDVVMIPAEQEERVLPADIDDEPGVSGPRSGPSFLTIHFVRCEEGRLQGTLDWVVIYWDAGGDHGQSTVVTARSGELAGRRVVRGREPECREHYA